jgi:hypothetical protein
MSTRTLAVATAIDLGIIRIPSRATSALTSWKDLAEREQELFDLWLAERISDGAYLLEWRAVDARFAELFPSYEEAA